MKTEPDYKDEAVKLAARVLELEDALERSEAAMGCALAIIDGAREMVPPFGVSAREALLQFADTQERVSVAMFPLWAEFVAYAREQVGVKT